MGPDERLLRLERFRAEGVGQETAVAGVGAVIGEENAGWEPFGVGGNCSFSVAQ